MKDKDSDAPSGEYVRRSDDRALAAAHTKIADQSTTIEAAFMAKCEAERALEAAQAERDALKAQLDPESVQHWDAMRAERDALKVDNERLLGDIDDAQSYLSDIVSPVTGPDGDCPEDLPLRVDEMAEGAVRFFKQAVSERDAARAEVERLRQAVDGDREWILRSRYTEAVKEHITTLRARVAELEGAVRDVTKGVVFKEDDGDVWLVPARPWNYIIVTPATAAVLRSVAAEEKKP